MKDLRICVERVVRPIRASARRKDRMREELLAHLTATYEEGMRQDEDPRTALSRAIERFGNPSEVRRELQRSVPSAERFLYARMPYFNVLEHWGRRRRGESAGRYASRLAVGLAAYCTAMTAVVVTLGWAGGQSKAPVNALIQFAVCVTGALCAWCFFLLFCATRFTEAIGPRPLPRKNLWRALGWCALILPVTVVCAGLFYLLAPGELVWFELTCRLLMLLTGFALAAPFIVAMFGAANAVDQRRYEAWGSLVLDELEVSR